MKRALAAIAFTGLLGLLLLAGNSFDHAEASTHYTLVFKTGDVDCDGSVTTRDGQAIQRYALQQAPLSQTEPCPEVGEYVDSRHNASGPLLFNRPFGDVDCDGVVDSRDYQMILRFTLGQPNDPCAVATSLSYNPSYNPPSGGYVAFVVGGGSAQLPGTNNYCLDRYVYKNGTLPLCNINVATGYAYYDWWQ